MKIELFKDIKGFLETQKYVFLICSWIRIKWFYSSDDYLGFSLKVRGCYFLSLFSYRIENTKPSLPLFFSWIVLHKLFLVWASFSFSIGMSSRIQLLSLFVYFKIWNILIEEIWISEFLALSAVNFMTALTKCRSLGKSVLIMINNSNYDRINILHMFSLTV